MTLIIVPKHEKLGEGFSKQEITESWVHGGRQTDPKKGYQSAVSWIADLIALRMLIFLCSFCRAKFNPRQFGYRKHYVPDASGKTDGYQVNAQCDSCKGWTPNLGGGTAFITEEGYRQVCIEPKSERTKARAAAKQLGVWVAIQREQQNQRR